MTTIETEAPVTAPPDERPVAELSREELFKWNTYVHVGPDAAECEHAEDGQCKDTAHFHAWVRLPNPFQVRDIEEKARAARARRRRALRDPESDAYAVLEDDLEAVRDTGDREGLIEEIVQRDWQHDYVTAVRDVMEEEDDSAEAEEGESAAKLYGNIDQDSEELRRQDALPEDQRSEEYDDLKRHVESYQERVNAETDRLQSERRASMADMGMDQLVDLVRRDRREWITTEVYVHTFNVWQWYVCTYKPCKGGTPHERMWKNLNEMTLESAPEVAGALKSAFTRLERGLADSRRAKN